MALNQAPSPPPSYGNATDPLSQQPTTSGQLLVQGTTGSAQIQSLLEQLYGGTSPFQRPGFGGGYGSTGGALAFLLEGGLDEQAAVNFVQNVFQALLDRNVDPTDVGANTFTALVQQMWANPLIRERFLLTPTATSVRAAVDTTLFGTRGRTLTTQLKAEDPGIYSLYRKYFGRNPTDAEVQQIKAHGDNEFQWEDFIRALPSHLANANIGQLFDARTGARALYNKYYGRPPSEAEVEQLLAHGTDQVQWEDFIRTLPSHIPGVAIGAYNDLRGLADSVSEQIYGNPSNDAIVQELYNGGNTNLDGVRYYYDQLPFQPGKHVAPIVYNAVYQSAAAYSRAVWNQEPHPVDLQSLWQKGGAPGSIPATQAMQMTNPQAA